MDKPIGCYSRVGSRQSDQMTVDIGRILPDRTRPHRRDEQDVMTSGSPRDDDADRDILQPINQPACCLTLRHVYTSLRENRVG